MINSYHYMIQSNKPKSIVLYADDDTDDIELVKDAFAQHTTDVELVTFSNGIEALAFLNKLNAIDLTPCLIILDINMPLLDGKEALARLKEMKHFEQVPAILFSTSSQEKDKEFADRYGAGFITKPLNAHQMEDIIEEFIEHCAEDVRNRIRKQVQ